MNNGVAAEEAERLDAICAAVSILPPESRRRIVELALENGYAAKDVAEIMAVSPPAVSRYIRGTLSPSPSALCRLILGVHPRLQRRMLLEAARSLWKATRVLLEVLGEQSDAAKLLEEIADTVALLLEKNSQVYRSPL